MIHTSRTITIRNERSVIDSPIILYRGDRGIEIGFTVLDHRFKFTNTSNLIQSSQAFYGQLVIKNPNGNNTMISEVGKCKDGEVILVISKEMIDGINEIGNYTFQIRLFDESQLSRITIPPIMGGIIIKEPIVSEDN